MVEPTASTLTRTSIGPGTGTALRFAPAPRAAVLLDPPGLHGEPSAPSTRLWIGLAEIPCFS